MDIEKSNATPVEYVETKEFIDGVLKAGSYISMVENKKLNMAMFFSLLLQKTKYRDFFADVTSSKNFKEAVSKLLYMHPNLVKSKHTKSAVRKISSEIKPNDRIRKTNLQQTSSSIKKSKK